MENLFKIAKVFLLCATFFLTIQDAISQQDFFVYRVKGEPYIEVNDSIKSITRGSKIDKNTMVKMNKNDMIYFINDKGDIFELFSTGEYTYGDLQKIPAITDNTSFTQKLSSYMWKEFTNNIAEKHDKGGVVYRGDDIVLMRHPADSIKIFNSEIKFEWNNIKDKVKEYYFLLKDVDTDQITKIGTHSTSISLFVDGSILKEGSHYKWAITETKYPNYNKTVFYNFTFLSQAQFEALAKEIKEISKFLAKLDFDKKEIREIICQDYKICY